MIPRLSRRDLAKGAGLVGLGAAATPAQATPAAPLRLTPAAAGQAAALMRVNADGSARMGVFDGEVIAFGADGAIRPFLGFRGVSRSRRLASGAVIYVETAVYYDLASGERLETFRNPFSGALAKVPYAAARIETPGAQDRAGRVLAADGRLTFKDEVRGVVQYEHGADGVTVTAATQTASYSADSAALMAGGGQGALVHGEWLRSGPWPAWLNIADAPGPCVHHCRFEAGAPRGALFERARQDLTAHPLSLFA